MNELVEKRMITKITSLRIRAISFLIIVFIFQGCSIPTDFYIQNQTLDTKTIEIKYNKTIDFSFEYGEGALTPKEFRNNNNKIIKVDSSNVKNSILALEIKPNSTIRISKTQNYRWKNWLIDYIIIDNNKMTIDEIAFLAEETKNDFIYTIK